jgi:uncharacterized repeat protein (TIGR03803 family)
LGGLIQGIDGDLYGTTEAGGASGFGTVFKMTLNGTLTTLHRFAGTDGANPWAGLIQATNGYLYGTTFAGGASSNCSGGCGTVFGITPKGVFTTLHSFIATDGFQPTAALVEANNGLLYGTTSDGGPPILNSFSYGTVFQMTSKGALAMIGFFIQRWNARHVALCRTDSSHRRGPLRDNIRGTVVDF